MEAWQQRWGAMAKRIAGQCANRWPRLDPRELEQVCLIVAWRYDASIAPTDEGHMANRMRWALIDHQRSVAWGNRPGAKQRGYKAMRLIPLEEQHHGAHFDRDPSLRMDFQRALALLPKHEREPIEHMDFVGAKQTEIAEARGVTASRISQRRARGLQKLKKLLVAYDHREDE